MNNKVGRLWT